MVYVCLCVLWVCTCVECIFMCTYCFVSTHRTVGMCMYMCMCICVSMRWCLLGLLVLFVFVETKVFGWGFNDVWSVGLRQTCGSLSVWISVTLHVCVCILLCVYLSMTNICVCNCDHFLLEIFSWSFPPLLLYNTASRGRSRLSSSLETAKEINIKKIAFFEKCWLLKMVTMV